MTETQLWNSTFVSHVHVSYYERVSWYMQKLYQTVKIEL